jgi:hypothetical protein
MGKKEPKKAKATEKNKIRRLMASGLGVAIATAIVAFIFFVPKGEPWSLPAIPRHPRPATLSPDLFTGKVAETYGIAREAPDLLEQMPCYCGCYVTAGHRNNLDCYTDRHAVG